MATIVLTGESLEGLKIDGSSRKPIEYKGIILVKGKKLHKFVSRFNTKANIREIMTDEERIIDTSHTSIDDTLFCDDAVLRSVDNKYSRELESNASSTHGTNSWKFAKHTNVMIVRSHQEIENGIRKRLEAEARKELQ